MRIGLLSYKSPNHKRYRDNYCLLAGGMIPFMRRYSTI